MAAAGTALTLQFPGWEFGTAGPPVAAASHDWLKDLEDLDDEDNSISAGRASPRCISPAAGTTYRAKRMIWEDGVWPSDVLHAVLLQLEAPRDLCSSRAVSSDWLAAASAEQLWDAAWERDTRLAGRPARTACGTASLAPPPSRHQSFWRFAIRTRAHRCYRWADLQKGWDRLEVLLQPSPAIAACTGGLSAPGVGGVLPGSDQKPAIGEVVRWEQGDGGAVHTAVHTSVRTAVHTAVHGEGLATARRLAAILTKRNWELVYDCLRLLQIECAESLGACVAPHGHARTWDCVRGWIQPGDGCVQGRVHQGDGCVQVLGDGCVQRLGNGCVRGCVQPGDGCVQPGIGRRPCGAGCGSSAAGASGAGGGASSRPDVTSCAATPCAAPLYVGPPSAASPCTPAPCRRPPLHPPPGPLHPPPNGIPCGGNCDPGAAGGSRQLQPAASRDRAGADEAFDVSRDTAAADEVLLRRLLCGFESFSSWLAAVSSTFDHQPGSGCACHLTCLVTAQRGSEMVDQGQHTPTLSAGGLAAFRSVVVLRPHMETSLRRHVARAQSSLLRHGGWTAESDRLMQTLIE